MKAQQISSTLTVVRSFSRMCHLIVSQFPLFWATSFLQFNCRNGRKKRRSLRIYKGSSGQPRTSCHNVKQYMLGAYKTHWGHASKNDKGLLARSIICKSVHVLRIALSLFTFLVVTSRGIYVIKVDFKQWNISVRHCDRTSPIKLKILKQDGGNCQTRVKIPQRFYKNFLVV